MPVLLAVFGLMLEGRATAQTFTTLHNFTSVSDGATPNDVILSGNTLYGTAVYGGSSGNGTVFAVNTNSTGFTNLYNFRAGGYNASFNYTNSDGANPNDVILSGNTFYGTATYGGTNGSGTVFTVNTNGKGFTTLYTFTATDVNGNNSDGAHPYASVILSGNMLYGTATYGGTNGNGTVFKVNTNGTGFSVLHTFAALPSATQPPNTDGAYPVGGLILSGNTLYGTASYGGTNGSGTVFAVNTNGNGFTALYTFTGTDVNGNNSDGAAPSASLILSGSTLYSTANTGGTNGNGTVFAVNTNGTGFSVLHTFTALNSASPPINTDGAAPENALVLSGSTLYGTALRGGTNGSGTVFAVSTDGNQFTTTYAFTATDVNGNNNDGARPYSYLILSGNTLYSTTTYGGTNDSGTVFSLSLGSVIVSASPQLTPLNYTNGQFSLMLTGTSGTNYIIQMSTNLAVNNWTAMITNTAINGTFRFTDASATNKSRYYRALKQ
jgi:uncharacterized repeat protein (TIGR03803 family)